MRILWAIFGIKMYALWYLHPSAKTKKTKAAALPMIQDPFVVQAFVTTPFFEKKCVCLDSANST